jgi:hypothetical protein
MPIWWWTQLLMNQDSDDEDINKDNYNSSENKVVEVVETVLYLILGIVIVGLLVISIKYMIELLPK